MKSETSLLVDPETQFEVIKALANPVRIAILRLLDAEGSKNINQLAEALKQPQSTISSGVQMLEAAGLLSTATEKARKGSQKICTATCSEVLISLGKLRQDTRENEIIVAMPIGLYTRWTVSAPCGLCSTEGIIGLLDVPNTFADPDRMKAGLLWFSRGYVEYQFPNNARLRNTDVSAIEVSMELSSEVPGTSADWPSDISLEINDVDVATWTSPGDFGDKRGVFTPPWWKLAGSQYGKLKTWRVNGDGSYVDGVKVSDVRLGDLALEEHHSIRVRIGVREDANHPGGINIFGRGFGNYDQDIILRII